MKVKHLLEEIERCKREYSDFIEWDVYTEQMGFKDIKDFKKKDLAFARSFFG